MTRQKRHSPPSRNFQKKLLSAAALPTDLFHRPRLPARCDYRLMSPSTLDIRRCFFRNFVWFLCHREYAVCATSELCQFLHYLRHGHEEQVAFCNTWISGKNPPLLTQPALVTVTISADHPANEAFRFPLADNIQFNVEVKSASHPDVILAIPATVKG